jgi:hypothetical protein
MLKPGKLFFFTVNIHLEIGRICHDSQATSDATIWSITQELSITLLEVSFTLLENIYYSTGHCGYDRNITITALFKAQATGVASFLKPSLIAYPSEAPCSVQLKG